MKAAFSPTSITKITPLNDVILVQDMVFDERVTTGGIILPNDNGKSSGIRPRWAQVYAVGPEQKEVQVGQYICISHGRWSRGIDITDDTGKKTIRRVDPNDVLMVSDEPVQDDTLSDKAS